jgi:hypothetical protein
MRASCGGRRDQLLPPASSACRAFCNIVLDATFSHCDRHAACCEIAADRATGRVQLVRAIAAGRYERRLRPAICGTLETTDLERAGRNKAAGAPFPA